MTRTCDHEGLTVISTMHDLKVELFDQLQIKSKMDIDKKIRYIHRILTGLVL